MTEKKAKDLYKNTSKIIENKLKEIELIQFLLDGGRISFKKGDLDSNVFIHNTGYDEKVYDKDYEYILGYGITNTRFIKNYLDNGFTKEEFEKDYAKSFDVSLYSLQLPFVNFYFSIKKKDYIGLEDTIKYLIEKEIPLKKIEVNLDLEKKLSDKYVGKHVYIEDLNISANIEYVYMINKELIFGVQGYRGRFLINTDRSEIKDNKIELTKFTDGATKEKQSLIDDFER